MRKSESGQTLIIVLLVVTISLLVGVGIATRSTSVVQQTTFSEEATQALHFAEACAEEALGVVKNGSPVIGSQFCCDVGGSGGCVERDPCDSADDCSYIIGELADLFPGKIDQDDVAEVKLAAASCNSIDIYWCNADDGCPPTPSNLGLETVIIYDDPFSGWETVKQIYGVGSGFAGDDGPDGDYEHSKMGFVIDPAKRPKALRLIPRYHGFHIGVVGSNPPGCDLGFQGYKILAEGWYGKSRRKVRVTKTEPAMPAIFDYTIFSGSETQPLKKR